MQKSGEASGVWGTRCCTVIRSLWYWDASLVPCSRTVCVCVCNVCLFLTALIIAPSSLTLSRLRKSHAPHTHAHARKTCTRPFFALLQCDAARQARQSIPFVSTLVHACPVPMGSRLKGTTRLMKRRLGGSPSAGNNSLPRRARASPAAAGGSSAPLRRARHIRVRHIPAAHTPCLPLPRSE